MVQQHDPAETAVAQTPATGVAGGPIVGSPADPAGSLSNILMAMGFVLVLFALALAQVIVPNRAFSPQENRYLAQKPALTGQTLLSAAYMTKIEEYLTDQFPGRDAWVSLKAMAQRLSGQLENNGVYYGRAGYLIGKLAPIDATIVEKNLLSVTRLQEAGYNVALLVSPTAAEILQEYLPSGAYLPDQADMLTALAAGAGAAFVDVSANLRQAKEAGQQIYYRTDHHWTTAGAYQAYLAYMAWLGQEPLLPADLASEVVSRNFYGTLWSKNSLPGISPDEITRQEPKVMPDYLVTHEENGRQRQESSLYAPAYLAEKDQYAYFLGANQPLVVIRSMVAAAPTAEDGSQRRQRLLIFKDSYAHCLVPYLLPHFAEIHLIDLRYWKLDPLPYLQEQQIDQVLFLYNGETFAADRTISQVGVYLAGR